MKKITLLIITILFIFMGYIVWIRNKTIEISNIPNKTGAVTLLTDLNTTKITIITSTISEIQEGTIVIGNNQPLLLSGGYASYNFPITYTQAMDFVFDSFESRNLKYDNIKLRIDGIYQIKERYYYGITHYTESEAVPDITSRVDNYYVDVETGEVYLFIEDFKNPSEDKEDKIVIIK